MEEKKENTHLKKIISESIRSERIISPVAYKDLILFKEEILKEMKVYQNKIDLSISKNNEKCEQLLEASNKKLYNYETDKVAFMKQMEFIEEKNKLLSIVNEKNSEIKNQLMVIDLHLNNCQKELNDACFKYDRVIVDNLLIPGIVGTGCKFPFFKEYINDIQTQINLAVSKNQQTMNNLTANKITTEGQIKQLNAKIKKLETDSKQFTNEKYILLDNKFTQSIETLNNKLTSVTTEYLKSNIELKDKVSEVKTIGQYIVEENRKINIKTLTEFEKMKKYIKKLKKNIVELSALLTTGGSYSGTGKFNKNIANNRQQIIQQFNSMIIGLMKDVTKENSLEFNNEINNVLFPKKKNVGSLIKQYIQGNIKAEDAKFDEKNKKNKKHNFNKKNTTSNINFIASGKKIITSLNKNEDLKLNTEFNGPKFNRYSSVEFKDSNKSNSNNNYNSNDILQIKNNILNNNSKIHVIKEEDNNNNKSSSLNDNSFSINSDDGIVFEEKENILKNINSKNIFEDKNLLKSENTPKKDKRKLFIRAVTSNLDNKLLSFGNNFNSKIENFKLLQKAQENAKRKNIEKKISFKSSENNSINPNKSVEKNKKENNINNNEEKIEKKEDYKIQTNNNVIFMQKTSEYTISDNSTIKKDDKRELNDININILKEKNMNNNAKNISIGDKIKINAWKKEEEEEKEKITSKNNNQKNSTTNTTKNMTTEKFHNDSNNNTNFNINVNNTYSSSPISIRPKSIINKKSDFQKSQIPKNRAQTQTKPAKNDLRNYSPESNFVNYSKNVAKNNAINLKKDYILSQNDNYNNYISNTSNQYKTQDNINNINNNKNVTLNSSNGRRSMPIMNSCRTRSISKYKVKRNYNLFTEDIFVDKNMINKLNYCKDEDIIDKPLLINQTDFKVDNIKGSLENKLLELEYFTKRKLDELVREIKNFIPIHFNAYIKE